MSQEYPAQFVIRERDGRRFFFDLDLDGISAEWRYGAAAVMSKEEADVIIRQYPEAELVRVA